MRLLKKQGDILLLIVISFLVYANSLSNSFVWDDQAVVAENAFVRQGNNIALIFSPDYFYVSGEMTYRPLVTLSYFMDYAIWKLKPFGFHLTNLLLHTLNGILIYLLLRLMNEVSIKLKAGRALSLLTAIIFLIHPINTEAVNVISFREDLLTLFFFLLSFIFFIQADRKENRSGIFYLSSLFAYLLALFSKEMAITLPIILLLYDIHSSPKETGERFYPRLIKAFKSKRKPYLGYLLVTAFYLWIRFQLLHNVQEKLVAYPGGSFYTNILTMSRVMVGYLKLLIFPLNLNADHLISPSLSLGEGSVILSLLLLIFLFVIIFRKIIPSGGIPSLAVFWLLITILPVSNLIPLGNIMAERYLYLPSVGFSLLLAAALVRLLPFKKLAIPLIILLLAFYSLNTIRRNSVWKNNFTLWSYTVRQSPLNPRVHTNLGLAYYRKGNIARAEKEYRQAIGLDKRQVKAYNNLGLLYYEKEKYTQAIKEYKKALDIEPSFSTAYYNLGLVYRKKGEEDKALRAFKKALQVNPYEAGAYYYLGIYYAEKGQTDKALENYRKTVELNPNHFDARNNLGLLYTREGKYREAESEYLAAIGAHPPNCPHHPIYLAHYNLANLYNMTGRYPKAIKQYKTALRLNPNQSQAHNNLGVAYAQMKMFEEARQEWRKALELDPKSISAQENLKK